MGLGNSTIVGIGGDPIVGSSFIDVLEKFEADPQTEYVVMVGEIGGDEEEKAAAFIEAQHDEAGRRLHRRLHGAARARRWATRARSSPARPAPPQGKKEALEAKGIRVGTTPTEAAQIVAEVARA